MKWQDQRLWFVAIAVGFLVLLTMLAAPGSPRSSGSTYSRSPDGYGAWYAYMQEQGTPLKRWQKPLNELPGSSDQPITLLQVNSTIQPASYNREWVEKGNTLIILGVWAPVSSSDFITVHNSPAGAVRIDTRRRLTGLRPNETVQLSDRFGAIVWQEPVGKGRLVFVVTPHLAANAYQDAPGNFKFLAQLVTQPKQPIWVDEYLHGYKDRQEIQKETQQNWAVYLAKTPLLPLFIQVVVLLLVLIWAQNRRFGRPQTLLPPSVNNSTAYIEALASVLHKAQSSEFVVDVVGTEEKRQIQTALGLGRDAIADELLRSAWVEQTGRSATEFDQVFHTLRRHRQLSDQELVAWVEKLQALRHQLP